MQAKRAAAADAISEAASLNYNQLREHFQEIDEARATAFRLRLAVSATCFAFVLFLAIKVSREVLAVVGDLSRGFARFAQGDFQAIPIATHDELGQLTARANDMAERLRTTLGRLADTSQGLERANSELESFSYSVAHDLRAPLRAINGYCTAIIEDVGDSSTATPSAIWNARRGAERMGLLIDALLSLSRVSRAALEREPVDLSALARSVSSSCAPRAPDARRRS